MPYKVPIHPWENLEGLWVRLHLDFAGPVMRKMFLILYGLSSKWIDVFPMSNITSKATINCLRNSFGTCGLTHVIVMDNSPSFASNEFQ